MKVGQAQCLLFAVLQVFMLPVFAHREKKSCNSKPKCFPKPHPKRHPKPEVPININNCNNAVTLLNRKLGASAAKVVLVPGSAEYASELGEFWNAELQETQPKVIVKPYTAQDASKVMKFIYDNGCKFAIKSGGHSTNKGANNSKSILIVTTALDTLAWKQNNVLSIGPGQRWADVYDFAGKNGRTCVGGRYAAVGVGGFLLGGGLSHYSYKHGFGADNIVNAQVVLADGTITDVNENNKPDLFWALKGGHNNFALVTRFDVKTVEMSKVFGGLLTVSPEHIDKVFDALYEWQTKYQAADLNASVEISFLRGPLVQSNDYSITSIVIFYGANVDHPPCLQPFYDLPVLASSLRLATHYDLTQELAMGNNNNKRHLFYTGSFEVNKQMNKFSHDAYMQTVGASALYNDPNAYTAYTIQTIGKNLLKNAGVTNALSVSNRDAPYVWYNIHMEYTDTALDSIVYKVARDAKNKIQAKARALGVDSNFLYINDAGKDQDVIDSYGDATVRKMRLVSKKYDPQQVFQAQCAGVFKLF